MGFCVLHYDKQTGSSPGLAMHIERGILRDGEWVPFTPKSADVSRSHLNRELIDDIKGSRNERIENRIKEAGVKVRKDSVRALTLIMSASTEDMQRISSEGKFDDWCHASIKWAQDTHGKENVVSAVLHMDETTPHLHLTVVPIVKGESKDQKYRREKAEKEAKEGKEQKKKRKYKKKDSEELRLCAADVAARSKFREYQTSYAQAVAEFGLERGIEQSPNSHIDINDWYKDLVKKGNNLKAEISHLEAERDDLEASNALTKAKVEGAVKNTAKGLGEALSSIGKGIGKGIAEIGTYTIPSKAREREMKANERADKAVAVAREEREKRQNAEREKTKAQNELNAFKTKYAPQLNEISRKNSLIEDLKEDLEQYKGLVKDCADLKLSAEDVITLKNSKVREEHTMLITNPLTQEKESRQLQFNGSKLLILVEQGWQFARKWIDSMLQALSHKREKEQSQQIKRSSGFKM